MKRPKVGSGSVRISLAAAGLLAAGSVGLWGWTHHRTETHIYSASGYGGYVGANRKHAPDTSLQRASDAYAAGRYGEADQVANDLIAQANGLPAASALWRDGGVGREALLARRIAAYVSARQGRFAEAKARFGALRQAAYESPDHGKQRAALGDVAPTLEEEGAFQQAVCTGALGDTRAEEAEMDGFLRAYPESILVHAAVKRVGRLHGGDVPKDTEALWKHAMAVQKSADAAEQRSRALCGPECVAELLRRGVAESSHTNAQSRKGIPEKLARVAGVAALASEMQTGGQGTSLAAMRETAGRHGLKLEGLSLTMKGLARQKLPLIALIAPGHYVLVEGVRSGGVSVWDPDAGGVGVSGRRTMAATDWERAWSGVALR